MVMDINLASSTNATAAKINIGNEPIKPSAGVELDLSSTIQAVNEADSSTETDENKPSAEELQQLVGELSDMMSMMRKGLAFRVDEHSGTNVVSVMDIDSGDIIRQIPNEEALELAQKLTEVTGFLMKTEA